MEILNNIWVWLVGILSGVSFTGIVAAVIYGCLKGGFNRTLQKINIEKIVEGVVNKQMERIKKVSFTQNIQPLVESELLKVYEKTNETVVKELQKTQEKYDKLVNVLEKFYAYFDDSLVSDSKKQELKEALDTAKTEKPKDIEIKEIEIEELEENKEQKEKTKKTKIER